MFTKDTSASPSLLVPFCGAAFVFWLSRAVYPGLLPPLGPMPAFSALLDEIPSWIREMVPSLNRPDAQVLTSLHREALTIVVREWALIAAGLLSSVLLLLRRRVGRWLALALAGALLASIVIGDASVVINEHLTPWGLWMVMARTAPPVAVRRWVDVAFYVLTLVILTRPSFRAVYAPAPEPNAPPP